MSIRSFFSLQVAFMHQTSGDLLSVGSDLFIDESAKDRIRLHRFSAERLDLKISSVNENDSGLYTCMLNEEKLSSYSLEIFSKSSRQDRLKQLSTDEREEREEILHEIEREMTQSSS
jgi:hypothetical protein